MIFYLLYLTSFCSYFSELVSLALGNRGIGWCPCWSLSIYSARERNGGTRRLRVPGLWGSLEPAFIFFLGPFLLVVNAMDCRRN